MSGRKCQGYWLADIAHIVSSYFWINPGKQFDNKMKINSRIFPYIGIAVVAVPVFAAGPKLPKVEILGKEYYYHEIKKGESIYGIAKQHGWDLEELVRLNPNASSEMAKGTRLYYPTGKITVVTEEPVSGIDMDSISYEPINHVVKKGETVYSISRQYNVPLDVIYAAYPDAKYGIKAGETIVIQQSPQTVSDKYLYYVVKPGDTLYSLAKKYHTSVEDILVANPSVSEKNFKIGDTIRLAINSNSKRIHTELVEEERLASVESYKVKKNDTWSSIAQETGVDEDTLKEANEDAPKPKKNEIVNIPVIETVQVEKEVEKEDPRELTSEGIQELYDSIHNIDSDQSMLDEVRIAAILDEPTSNKDLDFSRGFILAIEEMKDAPYKINFKIIDGRKSTDAVSSALDDFEPNLIVATADRNFPAFLADYGNTNHIEVINVFDVKNELYEDNPSMVQLLPPSSYFNQQMADRLYEEFADRKLIVVGMPDSNDGIAESLLPKFQEYDRSEIPVSGLSEFSVSDSDSYLIYAYPNKKEEVGDLLQAVENLKEKHPFVSMIVVGRPNWVTLNETYGDKFAEAEVVIPSRVWFDSESTAGNSFSSKFNEMFGGTPIRSFPSFAASGYDVAKYFIPSTARNGGDFNRGFSGSTDTLIQSEINLERVNNWGGFINPVGYLLKFRQGGFIDKELVK